MGTCSSCSVSLSLRSVSCSLRFMGATQGDGGTQVPGFERSTASSYESCRKQLTLYELNGHAFPDASITGGPDQGEARHAYARDRQ